MQQLYLWGPQTPLHPPPPGLLLLLLSSGRLLQLPGLPELELELLNTCVLLLLEEGDAPLGEGELRLVQTVAGFLGKQMES